MRIYDITFPLHAGLPVWPGDTPYTYTLNWKMAEGASVNLGNIAATVHAGTHADAPFHFRQDGLTVAELELETYIGPAVVIDVRNHETIAIADIVKFSLSETPRVLFQTGANLDFSQFPTRFPVMDANVPAFLHEQGVVLVGFDAPSVDPFDSKDLPNHHALDSFGIRILESLYLEEVPPGRYELIALPLRLLGADGSPVRAILRR